MTNLWTLQAHRAKHIENQSFYGKKQLSFCQKILRFWAAEKGVGTQERGKGRRKTRGWGMGISGQKRGIFGDFREKWRAETGKHRTSSMESSEVSATNSRCFMQKSPMFWGFRRVISGVFTPSHPQFFRICRKKMYISAIQRWGNIHEIIKWI